MDNHLHSIGQNLGHNYEEGAVIPDGTVAKALNSRYYTPSDRPGARFPHMWLDPRGSIRHWTGSTRNSPSSRARSATSGSRRAARCPERPAWRSSLKQLPDADPADGIEMGMRGAVLVRPDGHVAWRMPYMPSDPASELAGAVWRAAAVSGAVRIVEANGT